MCLDLCGEGSFEAWFDGWGRGSDGLRGNYNGEGQM